MGHLIEYFASLPETTVHHWLGGLNGFYCHVPNDPLKRWEGELNSGGTFWAHLTPHTANFALCMRYTGLYVQQAPAIEFAQRFETEFWRHCGPIPLLRVDEFLVSQWCCAVGRDWETFEQPIEAFLSWLKAHEDGYDHWHLLTPTADSTVAGEPQRRDGV